MEPLGLAELSACADQFDDAVSLSPDIDRFCSSSAWVLSAAETLMSPRASAIQRGEHGFFAVMKSTHGELPCFEPLELAWGLACPLLGRDVEALVDEVADHLAQRTDWIGCLIPGVTRDGPHQRALTRAGRPWYVLHNATTQRHIASLDGGVDGFLRRRSANFRKSLHKSLRAARAAGIEFETAGHAPDSAALYERIMAVEAGSWKSLAGVGISEGAMRDFYAAMLPRLQAKGRARVMFARHQDADIGYIMGAVFDGEYRGLQFSYQQPYARYSIGSLCQLHQIEALCEEGVRSYDLGTEVPYKARWAERTFLTELLILVRDV
ncbi:MAG: GNAT family N-acetyltransferase [Kofleriaceae bacterium]